MRPITVERFIRASPRRVFETVADIREFSKALPHVVKVDFLSEKKTGVGARFRETRLMKGKESVTELEVTEYISDDRVRMVADSHGTVWDSVFSVAQLEAGTTLTLVMEARAHRWLPRLINSLIRGVVTKAVEKDLDLVKQFCETDRN